MSTQLELTERDREIGQLETEIIKAWASNGGRLPQDAFVALLSGAKAACEHYANPEAAADRALDRLRRVAEAVKS